MIFETVLIALSIDSGEFVQPLGDLQSFENEWMEVEVLEYNSPRHNPSDEIQPQGAMDIDASHPSRPAVDENEVPIFLCERINLNYMNQDSGGT
jgi:DEP domain-containing protein 5